MKKINNWNLEIEDEFMQTIKNEYQTKNIAPEYENLFKVFELIDFKEVNVVVLGQDPYPKQGDANGIAFSVNRDNKLPASLRNIYKELESDLKIKRTKGDLTDIVKQGVLFLNTILTVEVGKPKSHHNLGWQNITDKIIEDLSRNGDKIFVLLGGDAKKYISKIDLKKNIVISAVHPSPLSAYRGFFGSKIFTKINEGLEEKGKNKIKW